jgi:hypothetical protein
MGFGVGMSLSFSFSKIAPSYPNLTVPSIQHR